MVSIRSDRSVKRQSLWLQLILGCSLGTALCWMGCSTREDPQVVAWRQALLLETEPTGTVTIETARAQIEEQPEVVLIGKAGMIRDLTQWWETGQAMFLISEGFPGSDYNIGPDHDPQTCPFCRWKWKTEDSRATIICVDAAGEVIPVDPRVLLQLKEGQEIVIRGRGTLDAEGMLQVTTSALFLRPAAP